MKDTIQKARRWLVRKLGGYDIPPFPLTEYRYEQAELERFGAVVNWTIRDGNPDEEFIREELACHIADKIKDRLEIQRMENCNHADPLKITYRTEFWITFNHPGSKVLNL